MPVMFESIKQFFDKKLVYVEEEQPLSNTFRTDLACAALLIEVINSDQKLEEQETEAFLAVLKENLNIEFLQLS